MYVACLCDDKRPESKASAPLFWPLLPWSLIEHSTQWVLSKHLHMNSWMHRQNGNIPLKNLIHLRQ